MTDESTPPEDGTNDGVNRRNVLKTTGAAVLGSGLGLGGSVVGGHAAIRESLVGIAAGEDEPGVSPKTVSVDLAPGESATVEKAVTTPEIPPKADIFLLEDETGSFFDDIDNLKRLAPDIWDEIAATGIDFTMGVGGFRDFAQDFYGFSNDWVYRRLQDLTTSKSDFVSGVNDLTAGGGFDFPEGYLEALHYVAVPSHPAIDSNGDSDTTDAQDTPTGRQPSWRPGSTRIVLFTTDAPCHERTDDGGAYPGDVTISETITALNGANITLIGLTPNGPGDISCVDQLANGTGGSVYATGADGSKIADAILEGLRNIPATVEPVASCDSGLSLSFSPSSQTVTSGDTATFTETISVDPDPPIDGNEDTLACTVDWLVNGESAGDAFVQEITVEVCADVVVDLIAGQDEDVGSVTVSEDGDDIEVTYALEDGWLMTESHLHLATDCDDIPQTGSGNPQVGRFEFSREYDPAVGTDTYVVDQATRGFVDADTLCIAAHAVVFNDGDGDGSFDPGERAETAWGEGEQFEQKGRGRGNWAMHFDYEVCD